MRMLLKENITTTVGCILEVKEYETTRQSCRTSTRGTMGQDLFLNKSAVMGGGLMGSQITLSPVMNSEDFEKAGPSLGAVVEKYV